MPTPNLDSLRTLMRMQGSTNMTPGDPYVNKRRAQIVSGEDDLAPSELDQKLGQIDIGDRYGVGVSRDEIRDSGIQRLKQRLGMITAAEGAKAQGDIASERVKGEYSVRAAQEAAKAAEARAQANQDAIAQRTQMQIDAAQRNQQANFAHADTAREDAQAFKGGQVSPTAIGAIARERQALTAAIAKAEPGVLGKFFGRTNARQPELDAFDNALNLAQRIQAQMPEASAEQGATALGETDLTPDEMGQVQKFLLMLRGH